MKKVLIVDDSPFFIKTIQDLLGEEGFQITTAGSGQEAIDLLSLATSTGGFDLLITDLVMPGVDGYDVAQHVREMNKCSKFMPVIMLTEKEITKEDARKHGCSAYVPKSDLHKLIPMSRALLKAFS